MHPNTSVQLMNIVNNFIFYCNDCNASRVFVEFPESADWLLHQGKVHLMQNLRLKGPPPPIFLALIDRPVNALQLCR